MKNSDYIIIGIVLVVVGYWFWKKNQSPAAGQIGSDTPLPRTTLPITGGVPVSPVGAIESAEARLIPNH